MARRHSTHGHRSCRRPPSPSGSVVEFRLPSAQVRIGSGSLRVGFGLRVCLVPHLVV